MVLQIRKVSMGKRLQNHTELDHLLERQHSRKWLLHITFHLTISLAVGSAQFTLFSTDDVSIMVF